MTRLKHGECVVVVVVVIDLVVVVAQSTNAIDLCCRL